MRLCRVIWSGCIISCTLLSKPGFGSRDGRQQLCPGHGYRISHTPFPLQALPIDECHPSYPEDSYSYSKLAGELLLASYTRAYGIRTYVTRPAGIYSPARRQQLAHTAAPATGWDPWLWAWVASEEAACAHRLLMEQAENLPRTRCTISQPMTPRLWSVAS